MALSGLSAFMDQLGLASCAGPLTAALLPLAGRGPLLSVGVPALGRLAFGRAALVRTGDQGVLVSGAKEKRFSELAVANMDFVWRCLRRLGVQEADADDALQQVLLVANAKLDLIPEGRERAFLFATAARVAANARRSVRRREAAMEQVSVRPKEPQISQESLSEQLRARALLDEVLEDLSEDLRQVFVLFEIEEIAIKDIAEMLDLPIGTVGSKLRRARKCFSDAVKRFKAKEDFAAKEGT
jgi:RNA polymerase sigma-70 factor (ECF subfamily)